MARRTNYEIVLRALTSGAEVELGDPPSTYRMVGHNLVVKATRQVLGGKASEPEPVWLNTDMRLSLFLKLCEKASDETIAGIAADNGLRSMLESRRKER